MNLGDSTFTCRSHGTGTPLYQRGAGGSHSAAEAPLPPPARLPLYLYGKNPTQVGLDGPALVVKTAHKAPARYPLARISRVIAGDRVQWRAEALAACRREGLPVVFIDAEGEPTGYLQPMQARPTRLDALIEEVLSRPDWGVHYEHWLRAERMALLHAWRQARRQAGREVADGEFGELVRQHVYRPQADAAPHPQQAGALAAYTLQTLHQAGLKPRYLGQGGGALELAADLNRLLGLALQLELHGLGSVIHGEDAAMLRILHAYGALFARHLPHLLGSLHRRFRTLLEEWR